MVRSSLMPGTRSMYFVYYCAHVPRLYLYDCSRYAALHVHFRVIHSSPQNRASCHSALFSSELFHHCITGALWPLSNECLYYTYIYRISAHPMSRSAAREQPWELGHTVETVSPRERGGTTPICSATREADRSKKSIYLSEPDLNTSRGTE